MLESTDVSTFDRQGVKVSSTMLERRPDSAHVRVDEQGLWMDDALVLARADIASVRLELHERATVRVLNRNGRGFSCVFTSNDDARDLLVALGRVPERTMTEVALVPTLLSAGFGRLPWWKALAAVGFMSAVWVIAFPGVLARTHLFFRGGFPDLPSWAAILPVAVVLAAAWALLPSLRRVRASGVGLDGVLNQKLQLGADGLRIPGALANDFVAYDEIRSVSSREDALVLTLRDGREITMRMEVSERLPEVVARIRGALEEKHPPVDEDVVALLRVPGTKGARIAALRELAVEEDASYRESRIPRERLWALVEGRQADEATRSRAAVALSANLIDAERERLRAATDAAANPRVRVAMDAIEHGDDDRLAERLDDIEEAEQAQPARQRMA